MVSCAFCQLLEIDVFCLCLEGLLLVILVVVLCGCFCWIALCGCFRKVCWDLILVGFVSCRIFDDVIGW